MEESKYYTPTIEEFYVGFEYEIFRDTGSAYDDWYDTKETLDIHDLLNYISQQSARVKHLDKEDIESLGFTQEGQCSWINKNNWYIEWMPGDTLDVFCVSDCRFKGTIKNKSELKKLMQQLGIYE